MPFTDPIPGNPPSQSTSEEAPLIAKMKPLVAWDSYPCLSASELLDNLRAAARWKYWRANTVVGVGDRYSSNPFNGRVYKCIKSGQTGSVQPIFTAGHCPILGQQIIDGTVLWEDRGPISRQRYDVRRAVHVCWLQKAAATAHEHSFSPGGNQRFDREAIHQHCLAQARLYAPVEVF